MDESLKRIDYLEPLESFDPAAFEAGDGVSQDVCNFVLTLALIYNDLKDLIFAHQVLAEMKPTGSFKISRLWGAHNGLYFHVIRLMVSLFHEITDLLKRSEGVLKNPFFQSVTRQLRLEERRVWDELVSAARGGKSASPESHFAMLMRNKVTFHYDPKGIFSGYRAFFSSDLPSAARAYVSRGDRMATTRYFFADAAANGYLFRTTEGQDGERLLLDSLRRLMAQNSPLTSIVHHFIQKRGFAYKAESDEV